jgi:hypothetical protein
MRNALVLASLCSLAAALAGAGEPSRHCFDSKALAREALGRVPEAGGAAALAEAAATRMGPPPGGDHQVGDEWNWYVWQLNGPPVADPRPATIRGKSDHAYLVVENEAWNRGLVDDAKVQVVLDHFENVNFTGGARPGGIYDLDVEAFGDPPLGLDQDPRIYLFYYDLDVDSDGFFWFFDTQPDATALYHSNECEVLYLNCGPDPGVDHDPAGAYMIGVVAHELEHLLHNACDPNEDSWVDEGLAEYAMFRYGADDPGWIADFLSDPDVALVPPPRVFPHYGAGWFFFTYLGGHFGGAPFTHALVQETQTGIAGIDATLAASGATDRFNDVFRDWVVANLLDDPSLGTGEWGYADYDFGPVAYAASHASLPVPVTTASVARWAADYVHFDGFGSLSLGFDGSDASAFALRVVELDRDGQLAPRVTDVTLDASRVGTHDVAPGSGYERAVLLPAALSPSVDRPTYTYQATGTAAPTPVLLFAVRAAPNPDTDLDLSWQGGTAPFDLYRALVKTDIGLPSGLIGSGVTSPHPVRDELEPLVFYNVLGR